MSEELINTSSTLPSTQSDITWDKVVLAFVLYAITFITIFGNVLVLVAVKINKKLQTTFNFYIVNLAITDVAVAVTAMSFMATHTVLGYWPFGEALCAIWIFFDYGMTFVSVFTLILISADRFWSVKWSVSYRQYHTKRKCIISIICMWLFMLILWVPPCVLDRVRYSEPGICYWDPSLNKELVFIVAILGHHGPFCIMVFCYTHVFLFMRKRAKVSDFSRAHTQIPKPSKTNITTVVSFALPKQTYLQQQPSRAFSPLPTNFRSAEVSNASVNISTFQDQQAGTSSFETQTRTLGESRLMRDRKVFVTLTYIIIGYCVLWLPFHIVFDISIINPDLVPEPVLNMAFWLTYLNSTVNPVLYNFSSYEFKRTFKRILRCCKCK